MKDKKRLNNQGFSLVELIIVIAIMAVLIGILAPQFVKYVAKSRQSADMTEVEGMANQIAALLADGDTSLSSSYTEVTTAVVSEVPKSRTNSKLTYYYKVDSNHIVHIAVVETGNPDTEGKDDLYPNIGTNAAVIYDKVAPAPAASAVPSADPSEEPS